MNVKHYLSAVAAAALMAGCSDYDPGLSGGALDYTDEELATINEYAASFAERYGTIDPTHTWGFGEKGSEDEAAGVKTRGVNVNRNNWVLRTEGPKYDENGTPMKDAAGQDIREVKWIVNTGELPEGTSIPGFPSVVDDRYYTEEGDFSSVDEIESKKITAVHPIGDVTNEEITQVSQWFRTHKDPESVEFNYSRFFMQEISQDFDRDASDPDEGAWDNAYDEPDDNWAYGTSEYGMDYLCIKAAGYSDWEHLNNYNNMSADYDSEGNLLTNHIEESDPNATGQTYPQRKIKYWYSNDGTTAVDFGYHGSHDDAIHNKWVICKVPYTLTVNGVEKTFESYYLAFDYEMDKTGMGGGKIYADGYYSNWIIKLSEGVETDTPTTPTTPTDTHTWYRVMCEDLGSTDDFDFNDLVFDVYYTGLGTTESPYIANVKVKAAGGILPIYIGEEKKANEAHEVLGAGSSYNSSTDRYQPVNVGLSLNGHTATKVLEIEVKDTDPNTIPIIVGGYTSSERTTFVLPESGVQSAAPQKICFPDTKTKWMKEKKQIETTYTHFADWVENEKGDYNFGRAKDWTEFELKNTEQLYTE